MSSQEPQPQDQQQEGKVVAELRAENGFLEDQLQRCLKELYLYQSPARDHAWVREQADRLPDVAAWNTSAAAMTPLAAAYDARIKELERLNHLQAEKLMGLASRAETLVLESEELHQAGRRRRRSLEEHGPEDGQENDGTSSEEAEDETGLATLKEAMVEELEQRADFLRHENAMLLEQADMAGHELSRASQALAEKDGHLERLVQELLETGRRLQAREQEVAELREAHGRHEADMEEVRLQQQQQRQPQQQQQQRSSLDHLSAAASGMALQETQAALATAQDQVRTLTQQVDGAHQRTQDLRAQWAEQHGALAARCQEAEAHVRALQDQVAAEAGKAQAAHAQAAELKATLHATQQDMAEMVRVMEDLQTKVQAYAAREGEVDAMALRSRQQLEEALLQRDQAMLGKAQTRRELTRALEARRDEGSGRAGDVEATAAQGKARLVEQYERREQELREAADRQAQLRGELEQCGRERLRSDTLYSELCAAVKDEHLSVRQQVLELARRLAESEVAHEKAESQAAAAIKERRQLRQDMAACQEKWAHTKRRLEDQRRCREGDLAEVRNQLATVEAALSAKTREVARLQHQQEDALAASQAKLEGMQASYQEQAEANAIKLLKAEAALSEQEPLVSNFQTRHARILQRIRVEHKTMMEELQRGLWDEKEAAHRVKQENQTLLSKLSATTHELQANKQELARLRRDLDTTTHQVCELSGQLSESLGSQQRLAKDEARLRAQLTRASGSSLLESGGSRGHGSTTRTAALTATSSMAPRRRAHME